MFGQAHDVVRDFHGVDAESERLLAEGVDSVEAVLGVHEFEKLAPEKRRDQMSAIQGELLEEVVLVVETGCTHDDLRKVDMWSDKSEQVLLGSERDSPIHHHGETFRCEACRQICSRESARSQMAIARDRTWLSPRLMVLRESGVSRERDSAGCSIVHPAILRFVRLSRELVSEC